MVVKVVWVVVGYDDDEKEKKRLMEELEKKEKTQNKEK